MSILQITFSIIGILFVVWLYALVLSENAPSIDLTKLQNRWYEYHQKPFLQKIRHIIFSIFQLVLYPIRGILWLLKVLKEVLAELFIYIVLKIIWGVIKFIFHIFARIFD